MLTLDVPSTTSCYYHRVGLPFSRLNVQPKVPVRFFNRVPPDSLPMLKRKGVKLVMDLDDYWHLSEDHYLKKQWDAAFTGPRTIAALKMSDVVTVATQALADRVAPYNPNVVIVPNALPFGEGQFTRREGMNGFVYAAGPSHANDLALLGEAANQADVTLAGVVAKHPEWDRMLRMAPRAQSAMFRKVTEYMGLYADHAVALAPLVDNEFNRCKSNLKLLEAAAAGLAVIASPVEPYRRVPGVMFANTQTMWAVAMTSCSFSRRLVAERAAELREHCVEHFHLDAANEIRRQILESFT